MTIPLVEIQIGQDVCIVTVDIHVSSALLSEGPQAKEANYVFLGRTVSRTAKI